MDDDRIWSTYEAEGEPPHRRFFNEVEHPSEAAARAYAKAHGLWVFYRAGPSGWLPPPGPDEVTIVPRWPSYPDGRR